VTTLEPLNGERFREVIGHFASGVTVVTALDGDRALGTTASAVCSLSLEPPMLLVCMNRASATGRAIDRGDRFAVNILSEEQADLATRFARPGGDFGGVSVEPGAGGEPLLAEALASIECRVVERAAGGTHRVFIAAAERAEARPGAAPLAYFRGEFGRLGPLAAAVN
jgi:flavin reductase (DIM6/NTAB) family NADH-FMN oxidoreductase RutF